MGAAPDPITLAPPSAPAAFLPLPPQKPKDFEPSFKTYQVGKASWYGGLFQGKATASGENYDMNDYTAAHRELPLGTFLRVTNLSNRKSVVVRVNDRGPFFPDRIIDLSYSAARSIGMPQNGLGKVRLEIVEPEYAEMAIAKQPSVQR